MSDVEKLVPVGEQWHRVLIGDNVWYYLNNQVDTVPQVATVVGFCEDNMVDLIVMTVNIRPALVLHKGVCLVGDPRLANVNRWKNGSWCPRPTVG